MKKIITLLNLFLVFSFAASAQYHYYPHVNAGQNPGNLNNDGEFPVGGGLSASWSNIQAGLASAPVWTANQTIPFTFVFNGTSFTEYKASTSGVLTFDTAAVTPPRYLRSGIPSIRIPDNSAVLWGLKVSGATYNNIVTKTFGSAPNRQHWVVFNMVATNGCYEFWGIVLEETTNKIYFVDMRGSKCSQSTLAIGLQFTSTSALQVKGSPSITHHSGSNSTSSDNSYYEFTPGPLPPVNIEFTSLTNPPFAMQPININIGGTITNYGDSAITGFTVKYKSGNNVYSDTRTGLHIASYDSYTFTHATPFHIGSAIIYPLKAWIEAAGDVDQTNDSLRTLTSGLTFKPEKNIVFEEGTGTWCGWCPRGTVFMDWLRINHPDRAMLIAVHDGDDMSFAEYDNNYSLLVSGFPSGLVSRKIIDIDPGDFPTYYDDEINDTVPCEVAVNTTYNNISRDLTINVSAHFVAGLEGDFRFNAVVTEDSVTGTGDGTNANNLDYDQENYYSYQTNNQPLVGAGRNWQTSTNPVDAPTIWYDHVARAILGGFDGEAGSLPSFIPIDTTILHTFTYNIPASSHPGKIKVVAWVNNKTTREIYNANKADNLVGIREVGQNLHHLLVYPNPSTGFVHIKSTEQGNLNMKVNVLNSLGETVASYEKLNFTNTQLIDLSKQSNGLYFIQFIDENNSVSFSKIMINR